MATHHPLKNGGQKSAPSACKGSGGRLRTSVDKPRSWGSSRLAKLVKLPLKPDVIKPGSGPWYYFSNKRETGDFECTVNSRLSAASLRVVASKYRYNLFTAADEKIPLSVVRVNKKPLYLVFSLHFPHQPAKYSQLPVESSKEHCATRTSAQSPTPCFMQFQQFQARRIRPLRFPSPLPN